MVLGLTCSISSAGQIAAVPHLGRRLGATWMTQTRGSQTPDVGERETQRWGLLDKELFFLQIFELLSFVNVPTLSLALG